MSHNVARRVQFDTAVAQSTYGMTVSQWTCRALARDAKKANSYQLAGEAGERLSLGQRQLIALARAFLKDPDVFILDEATSSVDSETERTIQRAVDRVLAHRISFVIAHRLSTIRRATRIVMVDGGRIVESGTHAELMRARGKYHDLYAQQFVEMRERAVLDVHG